MRIHVTRKIPQVALDKLFATGWDIFVGPEEQPSHQRLAWAAGGAVGLLTLPSEKINTEVMDRCPDLRVISQCGARVDNIDIAEASRRGVIVCSTPEVVSEVYPALASSAEERLAEMAVTNLIDALEGRKPAHQVF